MKSQFKMDGERRRVINRLFDLPLETAGLYKVELSLRPTGSQDWGIPVRVAAIPVLVKKPPEAPRRGPEPSGRAS